ISRGTLNVLAGTTFQQNKSTGVYINGVGYTNEALINSLLSASSVTVSYNNYSLYKYNAFFGRLNYNWADKYLIDATARRDGSSRFGPGMRFGNFGAVGAAWVFTKESFMDNVRFLSFGKLRASYGVTGNDQIPDYLYRTLYSTASSSYAYQGTSAYILSGLSNPTLQWESNKKLDIALELGFIHDRILVKADYYRNRSSNLLRYMTLPAQVGTGGYYANFPAMVQNSGLELELNTVNVENRNFKWNTSINLTVPRNKLLAFPDLVASGYGTTYAIGKPLDIRFLYHYTGLDANTGAPTFEDVDKSNSIGNEDRKIAPYGNPFFGGITNSLSYKGISLDFTFQYNHRNGYVDNALGSNPLGYTYENKPVTALNRWQKPGDNAFLPAATTAFPASYSNFFYSSDFNWGDASFLKLKTVSMSYTIPREWAKKAKMSAATVYVQGQNIFTWAKQKNTLDPETTLPGTGSALGTGQYIAMPQLRAIVFGINCTF
ncbi:MAG: TonB-dependent receptor, partial [Bacteroidetes bacterium]|nr:TonB-dependent receptor [Bacteroidota bacterium]